MRFIFFLFISFSYLFSHAHIFVYHRFDDTRHPSASTSTQQLTEQFEYLKTHNYKVVPLEKILTKIEKKESIPDNWVAFTIDDGYKSFYQNGLKTFKKYNYPFSLMVYVEATSRRYGDYMTWKEIKETAKYGSIGLHSYSHPRLQNLTKLQILSDTSKAVNLFKKHLGFEPTVYAYPYGEYNQRVQDVFKSYFHFRSFLNQNTGSVTKNTNILDIPRIALTGKSNIEKKLQYKTFDAIWLWPNQFPKNGVLKYVKAKVDPKYKKLKLYITGFGWSDIDVVDGIAYKKLNLYLKNSRTRIILGPDIYTISNKIINKSKHKGEKNVK